MKEKEALYGCECDWTLLGQTEMGIIRGIAFGSAALFKIGIRPMCWIHTPPPSNSHLFPGWHYIFRRDSPIKIFICHWHPGRGGESTTNSSRGCDTFTGSSVGRICRFSYRWRVVWWASKCFISRLSCLGKKLKLWMIWMKRSNGSTPQTYPCLKTNCTIRFWVLRI